MQIKVNNDEHKPGDIQYNSGQRFADLVKQLEENSILVNNDTRNQQDPLKYWKKLICVQ